MSTALAILTHTPWWVFLVFALLVFLGLQRLRPRVVALRRLFTTPAIFILWGLASLGAKAMEQPVLLLIWGGAAVAGLALGAVTTRADGMVVDRQRGLVRLPGSVVPLIRFMVVFILRYALAVAVARAPAAGSHIDLWEIGVAGAAAGFFAGSLLVLLHGIRRAAEADLAPTGAATG